MNMSYTSNPNLPKVRAEAVKMVRRGASTREVARHFGYSQSAVVKWCQKVHPEVRQFKVIPTETSRPHSHPNELDEVVVARILELRDDLEDCLLTEGDKCESSALSSQPNRL